MQRFYTDYCIHIYNIVLVIAIYELVKDMCVCVCVFELYTRVYINIIFFLKQTVLCYKIKINSLLIIIHLAYLSPPSGTALYYCE